MRGSAILRPTAQNEAEGQEVDPHGVREKALGQKREAHRGRLRMPGRNHVVEIGKQADVEQHPGTPRRPRQTQPPKQAASVAIWFEQNADGEEGRAPARK